MNSGFIQLVIIFLLLVVIISLLGVSLSSLVQNETLRENFGIVGNWTAWLWQKFVNFALKAWDSIAYWVTTPIMNTIQKLKPASE